MEFATREHYEASALGHMEALIYYTFKGYTGTEQQRRNATMDWIFEWE